MQDGNGRLAQAVWVRGPYLGAHTWCLVTGNLDRLVTSTLAGMRTA